MSSADFTYLTVRNLTAYHTNNTIVPNGYILTTSSNGKGNWQHADKVVFNSISTNVATQGPIISTIAAAVLSRSAVSTIAGNLPISSIVNTITSTILASDSIQGIVSTIIGQSLEVRKITFI